MHRRLVGLVLLIGCSLAHAEVGPRYLYQVSCAARVDRFDVATGRKTNSVDLAKRTGKVRLIPDAEGALEVCLSNRATFDRDKSVLYVLAPKLAHPKEDGTSDYRILGFSVPALTLTSEVAAGDNLDHPPQFEVRSGGVVTIDGEPPKSDLALSKFGPGRHGLVNRVLERSGDRTLVRLLTDGPLDIGVADSGTMTFVRMENLPFTTVEHVHLSPGGTHVLVEEVVKGDDPRSRKRTGRLVLYDAKTGRAAKALSEPAIIKLYFRGISPLGKVLYDLLDEYRFVDLRVRFPAVSVVRPASEDFAQPAVFFSDK
jgi:hypothetical protein